MIWYTSLFKGAHKIFGDPPIAVITSVFTWNSLSHASITLFLALQDVISDQIWISIIPQLAEFHQSLDLNHSTLIQSQVIGFGPLTLQFLATVIGQNLCYRGSTCLGVPNVPVGTSGCAERVCLHRDGCARMRSAYPECPDPNLSAYAGQDGGCRRQPGDNSR